MNWLRDKKRRFAASVLLGMTMSVLLAGGREAVPERETLAWWGTMYPRFCFAEKAKEDGENQNQAKHPKISFWLAQVLDW